MGTEWSDRTFLKCLDIKRKIKQKKTLSWSLLIGTVRNTPSTLIHSIYTLPWPSLPVWAGFKGRQGGKSLGSPQVFPSVPPALGVWACPSRFLRTCGSFPKPLLPKAFHSIAFLPGLSRLSVPTGTFRPRQQPALLPSDVLEKQPSAQPLSHPPALGETKAGPMHQSYRESAGRSGQAGSQGRKVHPAAPRTTPSHQKYRLPVFKATAGQGGGDGKN